ncbi:MAG: thioredoxin [Dehalococcoidales bacterium]
MPPNIVTLTDQNFQSQVIKNAIPVMVDFSAEWCGPCKMLAPVIEELADEYAGRIKVGKLDIDDNRETPGQYGIQGVPTLIIFQNGQPVKKFVGLISKDKITEALDQLL